ncbi:MAG: type I-F CRISPR-associated helicase Cas3f [Vibrio sp.]
MMVTFVSQCEKNALKRTRRVLDAFANRIGDNTWQTIITQEGLDTVKRMLRKTASRSTAVSCHWIRSRSRSQFLWVVGNKNKFNDEGYVAVNSTEKDLFNSEFESDWKYLPAIKALVGMAGLLHDWGKASLLFQQKLDPEINTRHKGDPIRHEWISCVLFNQLITSISTESTDTSWLEFLINHGIDESKFNKVSLIGKQSPLSGLPTAASLIIWLIVSHHRLPLPKDKDLCQHQRDKRNVSFSELLKNISQAWGYENRFEDYELLLPKCFDFPNGFLSESNIWTSQLKLKAKELLHQLPLIEVSMKDGSWRAILHHARLCLMLGDHFYSSQPNDNKWKSLSVLYANTDPSTKALKQKLDEHLVKVTEVAINAAKILPYFETNPLKADELSELSPKPNTPKKFKWQDKAVTKLNQWRTQTDDKTNAYFIVNMASTGCGKTIANAKIMQAISDDGQSLRFILALGLRTLTLQTGDEYKDRLKLQDKDLAVLIGSKSIFELHQSREAIDKDDNEASSSETGSESAECLQDDMDELHWKGILPEDELTTVLTSEKDRKLLYAPVLACTIDHIMSATETKRGGRYILPYLRLMSSDLVIDEIDDFIGDDLIAIGRLVHLAGMLGRKVMISSATIPPDLALGLFNAYRQGWKVFAASRDKLAKVNCVYIDEFNTDSELVGCENEAIEGFKNFQNHFIEKRLGKLKKQVVKRKAEIHLCSKGENESENKSIEEEYFSHIKQAILTKHRDHCTIEQTTQTKVSFGVVRMANIRPCVKLTQYLLSYDWPENVEVRCMAYHSQQILLLRHEQEKHLDQILKRKESLGEEPQAFSHPVIRGHLEQCHSKNLIFILVATPVEEVGRDHDFDWAVIEPSSFRSIIQMAGRVRRHRDNEMLKPNIALLQFNYKGFEGYHDRVFNYPGYEVDKETQLNSHDLTKLIDVKLLQRSLDASARVQKRSDLDPKNNLVDLEHFSMVRTFGIAQINSSQITPPKQGRFSRATQRRKPVNFWCDHLHGHITDYWWLTGLPQHFKRFRKSEPSIQLYLIKKNEQVNFYQRDDHGGFNVIELILDIQHMPITEEQKNRLWLERDYMELVKKYSQNSSEEYFTSLKFGEISVIHRDEQSGYSYNDQFGLVKVK